MNSLLKQRCCSQNAPGKQPSSRFQDGCRLPAAEADKGASGLCPCAPGHSPACRMGGCPVRSISTEHLARLLLSFPPSCVPWGSRQPFVKCRQMTPRYVGLRPAPQWRKHHHQQRKLLMRNAQDIHGRGNHSKQLALNYIFSDCKLLLTASLPSLQLTFLTKGHLLTSTPHFPGCVEP